MNVHPLPARRSVRTAFVLGGGGNLGSIQVGMLRALIERGVQPDLVFGCSVGALNSCAIAGDPTREGVRRLEEVWRQMDSETVFPSGRLAGPWLLLRKSLGMYGNEGLRAVIEESAAFGRFEEAAIPIEVVATSLETGRARWFGEGPIVEPVLASAALPGAFPPVEIDGEWFIDGAVVDNVPMSRAVAAGAERVFVLHVGNFARPRPRPQRPIDVLLQSFSIARNHRFEKESSTDWGDGVEVITLPGIDPGPLKRNDFSRTAELIERAYATTLTFLDRHDRAAVG